MKMKFTIPYRANWGEKLCVCLRFIHADDPKYDEWVDLEMYTRDGYLWEVETSTRDNKRHPFSYIHYYYRVLDADGKTCRIESLSEVRAYGYNPAKNYYFNDCWLEDKKEALSYQKGEYKNFPAKIELADTYLIDRVPLFEKTVIFKVSAPKLHPGETIALLGNHPTLGNWNTAHFLPMPPSGLDNDEYVLSVNVAPIEGPIEYKYVVIDKETMQFKRWEYGDNRKVSDVPIYQDDVYVLHGGELRTKKLTHGIQFDFDTYIFDLDGTLLSTLDDLAASCNYALRVNGLKEYSVDAVRMMVGNGIRLLMQRAVYSQKNVDEKEFEHIFRDFRNHYLAHNTDRTKPYPGIMDMLSALKARGKNVAVVSNKFCEATQALCKHYFGDLVDVAIGEKEGIKKKPAPDTVNEALRLMHASRGKAVYIGDSDVDVETARNSGMPCISVLWGFRDQDFLSEHGATIYVSSPEQLM